MEAVASRMHYSKEANLALRQHVMVKIDGVFKRVEIVDFRSFSGLRQYCIIVVGENSNNSIWVDEKDCDQISSEAIVRRV